MIKHWNTPDGIFIKNLAGDNFFRLEEVIDFKIVEEEKEYGFEASYFTIVAVKANETVQINEDESDTEEIKLSGEILGEGFSSYDDAVDEIEDLMDSLSKLVEVYD